MTLWRWKAVDELGKIHQGLIKSTEKNRVIARLRSRGLYLFRLRGVTLDTLWIWFNSRQALIYWARSARKIGTLLEAGIPLLTILNILEEKELNIFRKNEWQEVTLKVKDGNDLSFGLKGFIPAPGPFVESMIISGERSGTLAVSMIEVADQLEEDYFFNRKIKSTLFYPSLLLVVALVIVYTLSIVILPMYETLFQGLNAELPFVTQMLLKLGKGLPYLVFLVIIAVPLCATIGKGKISWAFPGTKRIRRQRTWQQFCTLLARLLNAGIPLMESMILLGQIFREKEIARFIEEMRKAVQEGKRITSVLGDSKFFPLEAAKMLEVAEESGRLSEMFGYIAQMFKRELEEKLQQYPKVLEPLLVLGMAGLVGLIAVGMLLPIFDLSMHIQ